MVLQAAGEFNVDLAKSVVVGDKETDIQAGVAAGGGFMMFFVSPEKRMNLIRTLNSFDGQVSNCHFSKYGSQAWRV